MATSALKTSILIALVLLGAAVVQGATTSRTTEDSPSEAASSSAPKATTPKSAISDASLDAALQDNRYLTRQLKCALGEAPCDPVGKRLKSLAPFVLRGACPKCTPGETRQIQKTLAHIQRTFPKEWARLVQTYAG